MRSSAVTLSVAIILVVAAFQALADTRENESGVPARRPNATLIARNFKCGGEELQCGGKLAKVCNLRNGKCCCMTVGTYH